MWSNRWLCKGSVLYKRHCPTKNGGIIVKKKQYRGLALLLALTLALTPALSGCSGSAEDSSSSVEPQSAVQTVEKESEISYQASTQEKDKEETVYIKANADGSAREITVETSLKNPGSGETVKDRSNLSDIKNTEGDEEYTLSPDGTLLWENHGEDIQYKGTSTQTLPVSLNVSYYLDGKEIAPEMLAGQSGKLRIRFDYENHTSETVRVNKHIGGEDREETVKVPVPFLAMTAMFLSEDCFSNVEVTNGKALTSEDQTIVIGYACPGLADSLKLTEYEPTEEVELPEYVEVTADVQDFELGFTATIVTPELLGEMDLDALDDVDEMVDGMEELLEASGELKDGTGELSRGLREFRTYLKQYVQGAVAVGEGVSALKKGISAMNAQTSQLEEGAAAISTALTEVNGLLSETIDADMLEDDTTADALAVEIESLLEQLKTDRETLVQLSGFLSEARAYVEQVESCVSTAQDSLNSIDLNKVESTGTAKAAEQAKAAAETALQDTSLTEEERSKIVNSIGESIDLSGITAEEQKKLAAAQSALAEIPSLTVPDLTLDTTELDELIAELETELGAMGGSSGLAAALLSGLAELQSGLEELETGSVALTQGIGAFATAMDQLSEGAAQLDNGASQLTTAGSALNTGFDSAVKGAQALAEGFATFDEEGIQSLGDLAGEDLADLAARIRALREAGAGYENFGGIQEGQSGSVRFIIETDEIEK